MFIFASLLSHHIIFDTHAASHDDLGAILDGLTRSISVHRGLSAIAQTSWHMFEHQLQQQFLESCNRQTRTLCEKTRSECSILLERLGTSDLGASSVAIYRKAIEVLQTLLDDLNSGGPVLRALQDWLILIPPEYIQYLNHRRPEDTGVPCLLWCPTTLCFRPLVRGGFGPPSNSSHQQSPGAILGRLARVAEPYGGASRAMMLEVT